MTLLADISHFSGFCAALARRGPHAPEQLAEIAFHTWTLFIRCLLPVIAVVFPFGMVIALQGLSIFELFGAQRLLSSMISVVSFRELAPLLASILVAAQGGSAIAAELGTMRLQEELDATEVMGIDSLQVHVLPRLSACIIATPLLNLVGAVGGVAGGAFSAVLLKGESWGVYYNSLWELTQASDIAGGLIKSVTFGLIIGLTACYHGYFVRGGAEGVGRAVNKTVVFACTSFIVANYFVSSALFGALH